MRLLAVLIASSVALAATAAHAATTPRLRVVAQQPLTVRGEGFRRGERVTITALTARGLSKRIVVRSTSRGRFGVTVRLPAQPCGGGFAVRAIGSLGSRATLMVPGGRVCVPPPVD
jgi:hypothetical protein